MHLRLWIKENGGDAVIGEMLGVSRQRVRDWRIGRVRPNSAMAYKLYKLGKGIMTLGEAAGMSEHLAAQMVKPRATLYNRGQS